MTLQWKAPFEINPNAETPQQRSLRSLNDTISGIGDSAISYHQKQIENARQAALLKIQQDQAARENASFSPIDPNAGGGMGGTSYPSPSAPSPSGSLQYGTNGPQPMSPPPTPGYDQPMSYSDGTPTSYQMPGGNPSQPAPAIDHTAHFMNWKAMGQPQVYDHPDYGGTGAAISQAQGGGNPSAGTPSSPGSTLDWNRFARMNQPQRQAYLEFYKTQADTMPGSKFYTPGQYKALQSGDDAAIAKEFPNGIPAAAGNAGLMSSRFGTTQTFKTTEFSDKQIENAQKAYNNDDNVKKAQGTLDKVTQAIPLLRAGSIDNATAKQALQTAMTYLATGGMRVNEVELKQFGGANTISNNMARWLQHVDDGTLTTRDAQDMAKTLTIFQGAAQKNLDDSGMRYAQQYVKRAGGKPEEAFSKITGRQYSRPGASSGGAPAPSGQPQFQVIKQNPKTGEKVGWDGSQWVPVQ